MRDMRFNYFKASAIVVAVLCVCHARAQERISGADMPQSWQYTEAFDQTIPTSDTWWQQFADPMLDSLIAVGIDNNYNVLQAQHRIEMARQALRQARAGYYPTFSFDAGYNKARTSGMTMRTPTAAVNSSYFDLGVDMSWQIDVFGKITARAKESKAAYQASRADYAAMMVTISSKIASAYMQLRTVQAELAVTQQHIDSQKRITQITQARYEAGLASRLDVSQALTTYYSTQASISSLQTAETTAINAIAVLLGVYPQDIEAALRRPAEMPDYHQIVGVGVPMQLLRRRPDVVEAEYTLAQQAAAVGVAKKDFLPTLTLNGSIGTSAHKVGDLFDRQSISYAIAPTLSWTIFEGMSRSAAVASAKEQMQIGIDNYNLTIVTAVQEVETAMAAYINDMAYIDYLSQVVDQAHESFTLSVDLYKQGLSPFINVTNSQITLLQYSNELLSAKGQALSDLITLYEALGGGWTGM